MFHAFMSCVSWSCSWVERLWLTSRYVLDRASKCLGWGVIFLSFLWSTVSESLKETRDKTIFYFTLTCKRTKECLGILPLDFISLLLIFVFHCNVWVILYRDQRPISFNTLQIYSFSIFHIFSVHLSKCIISDLGLW